jgi:hypothetical protein
MDITTVVSDVLDNQDLDVNLVGDFLQMSQDYQNQILMEELREDFNS